MCVCIAIAHANVAVIASDTSIHMPVGDGDRTEIAGTETGGRVVRVPGGWAAATGNSLGTKIGLDVLAHVGVGDIARAREALADALKRTADRLAIGTANGRAQMPMFFVIRERDEGATAHSFFMDGSPGIPAQEEDGSTVENTIVHFTYEGHGLDDAAANQRMAEIYSAPTLIGMLQQIGLFFQMARDVERVGPDIHIAVLLRDADRWESHFLAAPIPLVWGSHPDALWRAFGPPPPQATPIGYWLRERAERIIRRAAPRRELTPAA